MTHRTIGDRRRAPRRLVTTWLVALAAALSAGCAGGGSSGFDVTAAENAAIDEALSADTCVVERGLTICASGAGAPQSPTVTPGPEGTETATPPGRPSPTPTATGGPLQPAVDIAVDPGDVAACAALDASEPCSVRLVVMPTSVPGGSAYRAAVRTREPDGPWRVTELTGIALDVGVPPGVTALQTAILVYERDPGPVPSEIRVLSESGADYAFVTPLLVVRDGP